MLTITKPYHSTDEESRLTNIGNLITTRNLVIGVNILLLLAATAKSSEFNAAIALLCFI